MNRARDLLSGTNLFNTAKDERFHAETKAKRTQIEGMPGF